MERINSEYYLGIDTSNYKTSMALVDSNGKIIRNVQKQLKVEMGKRGLRQSEALFQHIQNLPDVSNLLFQDLEHDIVERIVCVAASSKPRPLNESYMPVFNAGVSLGKSLSFALEADYFEFSHQEGHIEAVRAYSPFKETKRFVSFHFSGGTTEAILLEETDGSTLYKIAGGSLDISFGQLLDRAGVAMGMEFPSGDEMDLSACNYKGCIAELPRIKSSDGYINLSGIETKCQQMVGKYNKDQLTASVFTYITKAISDMTIQIKDKYEVTDFLFAGGVSASKFIRSHIDLPAEINYCFGDFRLSGDNAVGIALLGGKKYAAETH